MRRDAVQLHVIHARALASGLEGIRARHRGLDDQNGSGTARRRFDLSSGIIGADFLVGREEQLDPVRQGAGERPQGVNGAHDATFHVVGAVV